MLKQKRIDQENGAKENGVKENGVEEAGVQALKKARSAEEDPLPKIADNYREIIRMVGLAIPRSFSPS